MHEIVDAETDRRRHLKQLVCERVEHLSEVGDVAEFACDKAVQEVCDRGEQEDREGDIDVEILRAVHSKKYRGEGGNAQYPEIGENVWGIIKILFLDLTTHKIEFITYFLYYIALIILMYNKRNYCNCYVDL